MVTHTSPTLEDKGGAIHEVVAIASMDAAAINPIKAGTPAIEVDATGPPALGIDQEDTTARDDATRPEV